MQKRFRSAVQATLDSIQKLLIPFDDIFPEVSTHLEENMTKNHVYFLPYSCSKEYKQDINHFLESKQ